MAKLELSIDYVNNNDIASVNIYTSNDQILWSKKGNTSSTKFFIEGIPKDKVTFVAVSTVTKSGNELPVWQSPKQSIVATERVGIPSTPTNFSAIQIDDDVSFTWDANTEDFFSHYEIRRGITWASGIEVGNNITTPSLLWKWPFSGSTFKFFIKSFSDTGQDSTSAAETSLAITAQENSILTATVDHTSTFQGTLTNAEVSGTDLIPSSIPSITNYTVSIVNASTHHVWDAYYPEASWISTPIDLGNVQTIRIEPDGTFTTDNLEYGEIYELDTPIGGYQNSDRWNSTDDEIYTGSVRIDGDDTAQSINEYIDIATTDTATPAWQGFRTFHGGELRCRHYRHKIEILSKWGIDRRRVKEFVVNTWKRNKKMEGRGISTTAEEDPVVFADYFDYAFTQPPSVIVHIEGDYTQNNYTEIHDVTTTSFDFHVHGPADMLIGGVPVMWIATGV